MTNKFEDILKSLEPSRKPKSPECAYCGTTNGLRLYHDFPEKEYTCEDCFTDPNDCLCFDDLPEVE